jgi:hypothetical protein
VRSKRQLEQYDQAVVRTARELSEAETAHSAALRDLHRSEEERVDAVTRTLEEEERVEREMAQKVGEREALTVEARAMVAQLEAVHARWLARSDRVSLDVTRNKVLGELGLRCFRESLAALQRANSGAEYGFDEVAQLEALLAQQRRRADEQRALVDEELRHLREFAAQLEAHAARPAFNAVSRRVGDALALPAVKGARPASPRAAV